MAKKIGKFIHAPDGEEDCLELDILHLLEIEPVSLTLFDFGSMRQKTVSFGIELEASEDEENVLFHVFSENPVYSERWSYPSIDFATALEKSARERTEVFSCGEIYNKICQVKTEMADQLFKKNGFVAEGKQIDVSGFVWVNGKKVASFDVLSTKSIIGKGVIVSIDKVVSIAKLDSLPNLSVQIIHDKIELNGNAVSVREISDNSFEFTLQETTVKFLDAPEKPRKKLSGIEFIKNRTALLDNIKMRQRSLVDELDFL